MAPRAEDFNATSARQRKRTEFAYGSAVGPPVLDSSAVALLVPEEDSNLSCKLLKAFMVAFWIWRDTPKDTPNL